MDKKKYEELKLYDIIEMDDEIFIILKVKGKNLIKPININYNQLSIVKNIRANKRKRNDIYILLKGNKTLKKISYGLFISEHFIQFYSSNDKKVLKIDSTDGIILAIDNKIPIFYDKNIKMFVGINDFINSFYGDFDEFVDKDNIM